MPIDGFQHINTRSVDVERTREVLVITARADRSGNVTGRVLLRLARIDDAHVGVGVMRDKPHGRDQEIVAHASHATRHVR